MLNTLSKNIIITNATHVSHTTNSTEKGDNKFRQYCPLDMYNDSGAILTMCATIQQPNNNTIQFRNGILDRTHTPRCSSYEQISPAT